MSKELFVTSTPHETKLAITEDDRLVEIYFERENEYTLAGSIYKGRVTRVLPGMQSAFVDIGLDRDAFLYVTDFLEEVEGDDDLEPVSQRVPDKGRREKAQPARPQPEAAGDEASIEIETDLTHVAEVDANEQTEAAISEQLTEEDHSRTEIPERTGARRWRGRRGRRRGRGGALRAEPQVQSETTTDVPNHEEASAAEDEPVETAKTEERNIPPAVEAEQREEPRREREKEAPARPRYEPMLLPGESLRKFNRQDVADKGDSPRATPESQPQSQTRFSRPAPRPSTEVTDPAAFLAASQGVLAGESLAKYRNRPQAPTTELASTVPAPEIRTDEAERVKEQGEAVAGVIGHETVETVFAPELLEEEQALPSERTEGEAQRQARAEQGTGSYNFAPGQGLVEEEEIQHNEEEQELAHYGAVSDESEFEELEEETLEADDDASRKEEEMIAAGERLAAAIAESRSIEVDRPVEETDDAIEDDDEDDEEDALDSADDELEEAEILSATGEADPEDPGYEGRADVRASAGTAGFQQRVERTNRGFDRGRGGRPSRGRRMGKRGPMRGRRNIPRGPMPQINELLKEGQEILVQIAKEPMAKKGARITSHIALPGRFLVFMPTVNHTGVSRKIGSDEERRRLKHILISEKGDTHGGFIVRTAAAGASEEDLRADIRFLINLWSEIKGRSDSGKAPALIYHDLNLVERILRDQVTGTFSQIWVDTENEYERILRFAQRFQPSLLKRVKLYTKETPLFEQFNVQDEINKALKSKVWLKSGGYIVINQTEALVAIDINTGKYVGKTGRLEDTIVKTNIDAIQEIVRQIRLRDLGGIIIIDFIDMDERKNRHKVMQALEEALKSDRSPSKVLQFNDFGLVAITRKRVKQSLERTLSTQCIYCTGTGMIKSVATICNEIYVEMRKMAKHLESHQVMLRVNPEVAKALKENGGKWLTEMEEVLGRTIIVKSDPAQHQEQFEIH
jgi:ribonuclease G